MNPSGIQGSGKSATRPRGRRRGSLPSLPLMVRVVLPLAAGAVLAPLPTWAGSPTESVPAAARAVFVEAVLREEGWVETETGSAGAESEIQLLRAVRGKQRLGTGGLLSAVLERPQILPTPEFKCFVAPRGDPPRSHRDFVSTHSPRAPPEVKS
jgi:hypothetical protein